MVCLLSSHVFCQKVFDALYSKDLLLYYDSVMINFIFFPKNTLVSIIFMPFLWVAGFAGFPDFSVVVFFVVVVVVVLFVIYLGWFLSLNDIIWMDFSRFYH